MAQLMPLPLMSLASVKSRLVSPFWYELTWVVPDTWPLNVRVCVCVYVCVCVLYDALATHLCSSNRQHLSHDDSLEVKVKIIKLPV